MGGLRSVADVCMRDKRKWEWMLLGGRVLGMGGRFCGGR